MPEESFPYRFNARNQTVLILPPPDDADDPCSRSQGTYWYHSHFQAQYCDGLRGALVIYDPEDPQRALYDIDDGKIDAVF